VWVSSRANPGPATWFSEQALSCQDAPEPPPVFVPGMLPYLFPDQPDIADHGEAAVTPPPPIGG
jgi:hypothetical protein